MTSILLAVNRLYIGPTYRAYDGLDRLGEHETVESAFFTPARILSSSGVSYCHDSRARARPNDPNRPQLRVRRRVSERKNYPGNRRPSLWHDRCRSEEHTSELQSHSF